MATSKEVTAKKSTDLSPDLRNVFEENAGHGFEDADADSYAIPFVAVLQQLSPQVDESKPGEYVKGAKPGMIFNSVTQATAKEIVVVPVRFRRTVGEWIPRTEGGGFVAEHTVQEAESLLGENLRRLRRDSVDGKIKRDGHEFIDTSKHYVLACFDGTEFEPAVMSFSSTQLKKSRRWMTVMNNLRFHRDDGSSYQPPMFASVFKFWSVPESNDKGSWHGWAFERVGDTADPNLVSMARDFEAALLSGQVKEQQPVQEQGEDFDEEVGF